MSSIQQPVISLRDVRLTLPSRAGPIEILKGVSLTVGEGEAVGIVGPSGSGKTSLLMVMAGLELASSGSLEVAGQSLQGLDEEALSALRRGTVGIVFQAFHLISSLNALENVMIPLQFRGVAKAETIARDCLADVGLAHRLLHYPGQLSGGEQQRVAIARAVAAGSRVVLADEPTGNLDQETGNSIMDLLFRLRDQRSTSLVLVTHDMALAARCDRLISVRDGLITGDRVQH